MKKDYQIEDCVKDAIFNIEKYIKETTGIKASQKEIAAALSKYFVLKEILDFILLDREQNA